MLTCICFELVISCVSQKSDEQAVLNFQENENRDRETDKRNEWINKYVHLNLSIREELTSPQMETCMPQVTQNAHAEEI